MIRPYIILIVLGCLIIQNGIAQFNLKVGYQLGFIDAPTNNRIITEHNDIADGYTKPFESLQSLHGCEVALRHRVEDFSYELGWKIHRNMLMAEGVTASGSNYDNKITYSLHGVRSGVYRHFGLVHIGGTLDYNWLRITTAFSNPETESKLTDNLFSSDFVVAYTFRSSGSMTLSLQPFYRINWGSYNIRGLDSELNDAHEQSALNERFKAFGLSLVIYNGRQ